MAARLVDQVQELEQQSVLNMTTREAESRLVTLQFARAAQVYLRVVVFAQSSDLGPIKGAASVSTKQ